MSKYTKKDEPNKYINDAGTYAAQARLLLVRSGDTRTEAISAELAKLVGQICALDSKPEERING
jgi:hypothetical protein